MEHEDFNEKLKQHIVSRNFEKIVDFDNHLDNIHLDWLQNSSVKAALF